MPTRTWASRLVRLGGAAGAALVTLALPATAAAHQASAVYASRLPLAVYVAGAGLVVALSFVFVLARDLRAAVPAPDSAQRVIVPGALRGLLRVLGLVAWTWIMAQGIVGGSSSAEVGHLFLWIYGWVGLAMVSAFVGPAWEWLDPFATLHDLGAWALRQLGVTDITPAELPTRLAIWPAVAGFALFVGLELILGGGDAFTLFAVVLAYTVFTLAMMAQFGRDEWRASGETFTVWFGLLGRLAPLTLTDDDGSLRRRGFGTGLLEEGWLAADVVLVGLGTGSILFDGLSQTQAWFNLFGAPATLGQAGLLVAFLAVIVGAAFLAVRAVGVPATGAALLPIAIGYLVAHYLTYLLVDGQRIVVALADPLQQGWALLPTAFYEPSGAWLPAGLVWTIQLAAVVGGHMLGAWGGHVVAARDTGRTTNDARPGRDRRLREVPLAIVMVGLTTLTLWSLGQSLVVQAP